MKTLLLNSTYQPISFVSERKALKLLFKNKVDVISDWDEVIKWNLGRNKIKLPAIIKLKYYVRWIPSRTRFNRLAVFKRDNNICQYCGKKLSNSELTVDHIVPISRGGLNNWKNCVTSCSPCNNNKGSRTPEEAGMKIKNAPQTPGLSISYEYSSLRRRHEDWETYLNI